VAAYSGTGVAQRREGELNASRLAHSTDGEHIDDTAALQGIGEVVCADIGEGRRVRPEIVLHNSNLREVHEFRVLTTIDLTTTTEEQITRIHFFNYKNMDSTALRVVVAHERDDELKRARELISQLRHELAGWMNDAPKLVIGSYYSLPERVIEDHSRFDETAYTVFRFEGTVDSYTQSSGGHGGAVTGIIVPDPPSIVYGPFRVFAAPWKYGDIYNPDDMLPGANERLYLPFGECHYCNEDEWYADYNLVFTPDAELDWELVHTIDTTV
jgi:hypothetical protein